MNLKYPHLPKTLGTIIQENYLTFYPSEPFRMSHFEMRYPVVLEIYNFAPVQAIRDASDDRDAEKNAFFKDFLSKGKQLLDSYIKNHCIGKTLEAFGLKPDHWLL